MENIGMIFAAVVLALGLTACSAQNEALNKPPGTYESESQSTDSAGTTRKTKTTTNVTEDANGRKSATVNNKTSTDPKGLFNKSTSKESATVHEN